MTEILYKNIENESKILSRKKRFAIIGSGISGLTAAYLLKRRHHVTLFESNNYLGGHTATVDISIDEKNIAVDTGFIVFNDRTYPRFEQLIKQLDVQIKPTKMSFSVHNSETGMQYNGSNLNTLFSQRKNLLNWRFYRFISEILSFNRLAKTINKTNKLKTLGDLLSKYKYSKYFIDHYILAMVSAIWSSPLHNCYNIPLKLFLDFFNNHGLLDILNRPQWYVIKGGSKNYIPRMIKGLTDIRLSTPVRSIKRIRPGIRVNTENNSENFDEVILACHSNEALALLSDATAEENKLLSCLKYINNEVVLHTDLKMLPPVKRAVASWNYFLNHRTHSAPQVTYNMNLLQGLNTKSTLCVTLNRTSEINPKKILRQFNYSHPAFSLEFILAQSQREKICGKQHTHYCGAYWYNGFHEDGVRSALDICQRFGETLAYQPSSNQ
ncbi:MAG: FAD-dependent oxidoreductase [Gammaproteobacteria bacterium]|nr:FAD-dependent oxidoreductase [Gammaproteobacteria bacterium]